LIEGVLSKNLQTIVIFIDLSKAFDSIHRGKMMNILKAYGIPVKLVQVIEKLYQNTSAKVLTPDGETELFSITAGVLQGDTLAPYLFILVLDYIMRQTLGDRETELGFELESRKSSRYPPVVINDLDFADDIALLAEKILQAQEVLLRLENESAKVGLHLNAKKTKFMAYNLAAPITIKTRSGDLVEEVKNFKYLGSNMESSEKDLEVRKALAWSSCHKLRKVWNSQLSRKIKLKLFIATVESILLYGSETWTLTKSSIKSLNGCYTRMLRMCLNVSWMQKLSNEQLYQDLPPISEKIKARRLKLAAHCVRHTDIIASKLVLWEPTKGRKSRGRPKVNYIDNLRADTNLHDVREIQSLMKDREEWRRLSSLARAGARPK